LAIIFRPTLDLMLAGVPDRLRKCVLIGRIESLVLVESTSADKAATVGGGDPVGCEDLELLELPALLCSFSSMTLAGDFMSIFGNNDPYFFDR
jgi:hypothetical protein